MSPAGPTLGSGSAAVTGDGALAPGWHRQRAAPAPPRCGVQVQNKARTERSCKPAQRPRPGAGDVPWASLTLDARHRGPVGTADVAGRSIPYTKPIFFITTPSQNHEAHPSSPVPVQGPRGAEGSISPAQKQTWVPTAPGCSRLPTQGDCSGGRRASGDRANPTGTTRKAPCEEVPSSGPAPYAPGGRSRYTRPRSSSIFLFSACPGGLSQATGTALGLAVVPAGVGADRVPPGRELGASPPTSQCN